MEVVSKDLLDLKRKLRKIEQEIEEARGGLRLLWKRILSLSHTLGELMVRQGELKKEIEESEQKQRGGGLKCF